MKQFLKILIAYSLLFICITSGRTIHVFGDSHAWHCFIDSKKSETFLYPFVHNTVLKQMPFCIHWLGSIPMKQFAQEKTKVLDICNYGVTDDDIVIFVFGEIDVRYHIGPRVFKTRKSIDEVVDELVHGYFEAIKRSIANYNNLVVVVMGVLPTRNLKSINLSEKCAPLIHRIAYTNCLNSHLKKWCNCANFYFLDVFDLYAIQGGLLNAKYADETVHINYRYNGPIKERLMKLVGHLV